jgi:hypothetical protein
LKQTNKRAPVWKGKCNAERFKYAKKQYAVDELASAIVR